MKKFLLYILLFFSIIFVIDRIFGCGCKFINENPRGIGSDYELCKESKYDIIIMGSSRAHRHYVPQIFKDSLGMSVYNAGREGNGIILMYGVYEMIRERYKPKMIVYDVFAPFDFCKYFQDMNNTRYLGYLKPYYDEPRIKDIFDKVNGDEGLLMHSYFYRYNSSFVKAFMEYVHPRNERADGYAPINKKMPDDYVLPKDDNSSKSEFDSLKIEYLEKMMDVTKKDGVKFVCVISPSYESTTSSKYDVVKGLCSKYNILCLDHMCDEDIIHNKNMWAESVHMNSNGAEFFSKKVAHELISKKD